MYSTMHNY